MHEFNDHLKKRGVHIDTVILYGDSKETAIDDLFIEVLSDRFCVTVVSNSTIMQAGDTHNDSILLIITDSISEIQKPNSIVIFKPHTNEATFKKLHRSTHTIVDSSSAQQLRRLGKSIRNVYTCGFSSKDYMTFSSRDDDKAIISLQRSVCTVHGNVCDPLELPYSISSKMKDYSVLSSTMALVLLDIVF